MKTSPHPLAAAFNVAALIAVLLCADLTVHSIDQIRDFAVSRELVEGVATPVASPRFMDLYTLPAYFYFILAIPIAFSREPAFSFVFFGLFHIGAVAWSGRWLAARGLCSEPVFVALGYGFLTLFLAHSAWNNGHLYAWNCLLLVATLQAWRRGSWWIAVQFALLCLMCTISPSTAPLGLTTLLAVARHRRDWRAWAAFAAGGLAHAPMFAYWLRVDTNADRIVGGGSPAQPAIDRLVAFAANLTDFGKWKQAWFIAATQAGEMLGSWASLLVAGALIAVLGLVAAALVAAFRPGDDTARSATGLLAAAAGLWWVLAMGALPVGAFYYVYTILPWFAALAAAGAVVLGSAAGRHQAWATNALAAGLFAAHAVPQGALYTTLARDGPVKVTFASIAFSNTARDTRLTLFAYRHQREVLDALNSRGACAERIVGPWSEPLKHYTFEAELRRCDAGARPSLFVVYAGDHPASPVATGRNPIVRNPLVKTYEIPAADVILLAGESEHRERLSYALRRAAKLPPQLAVAIPEPAGRALVNLRCEGEMAVRLRFDDGAAYAITGLEDHGSHLYWADIAVPAQSETLTLEFAALPQPRCDWSVVFVR